MVKDNNKNKNNNNNSSNSLVVGRWPQTKSHFFKSLFQKSFNRFFRFRETLGSKRASSRSFGESRRSDDPAGIFLALDKLDLSTQNKKEKVDWVQSVPTK